MEEYEKYLNKAFHFLSYRPRSEKEVRDFLLKKPLKRRFAPEPEVISPEVFERVMTSLKEQNFVNDENFTRWWVEQRTKFKAKGLRLIRMELKQKGIADEVIAQVFEHQNDTEQSFGQTEVRNEADLVKDIVAKKIAKYKGLPRQEIYQKLGTLLGRRGFDWETSRKAIDASLKNDTLQEE